MVKEERGSLHVSLLLTLLIFSLAGFGTWGVMRHWRHLTVLQLRLDRCVGEAALMLKKSLQRIERTNDRIRELRAVIATTSLTGDQAVLIDLLVAVARIQDGELLRWQGQQLAWIARRGCGTLTDFASPLPGMHWVRPPPDVLGPQPLHWDPAISQRLGIEMRHVPRAAAAEVRKDESEWKASWAIP